MKILFATACLLLLSMKIQAQEYPKVELFGGYSHLRTGGETIDLTPLGGVGNATLKAGDLNGFNVSLIGNPHPKVGLLADFGGYYGPLNYTVRNGGSPVSVPARASFYTFLFGPQFHVRGADNKHTFFIHPVAGLVHARQTVSGQGNADARNAFGAAIGGGYDRRLSNRVSIRLFQVDYLVSRFDLGLGPRTQSNLRFSTGFVFRNKE
jgi:hypothetical protein